MPIFDEMVSWIEDLQERIVGALESVDGGRPFVRDDWTRTPEEAGDASPVLGGYGRTRVLEGGGVIERGGVNVSNVHGRFTEAHAATMPGEGRDFQACGISLVLHPWNPHCPTVHLNYRRISRGETGWFGGGADLTPTFLYEEDARHFHETLERVCRAHSEVANYPSMKEACDRYFYLPHRQEHRGVGGIFFDHLQDDPEATFAFVRAAGESFLEAYLPVVERRARMPFTEEERAWQLYRRGRYVEFNLVWDRGTSFGLRTGGRIESILMSMPAEARWSYAREVQPGTPESALMDVIQSPRNWV